VIRVAFTLVGGKNWTGGRNYLLNLLGALQQHAAKRIAPLLFVDAAADADDIAPFRDMQGVEIVSTPLLDTRRHPRALAAALLLGRDPAWARLLKQHRVDLIFEAAQFHGWRLGIPAVAWIPDFQHKYLPHLFSRASWFKREIGYRAQIAAGRRIMLSSDDARQACERFYPSSRNRTHTVHFAVPPGPNVSHEQAQAVAASYDLPEHFFFMPNQFWKHKNHELVLDALSLAKAAGHDVVVAASGRQLDTRDPAYFPNFLKRLEQLDLARNFRLLGMIPYRDLLCLMRASSALLNPSLFEGWSTTVEEAKALGTPMLLSDLDVHCEQAGDQAVYFDRQDPAALARALAEFKRLPVDERSTQAARAQIDAQARVAKFADDFASLAEHYAGANQ